VALQVSLRAHRGWRPRNISTHIALFALSAHVDEQ
jgi:hypothetical protein